MVTLGIVLALIVLTIIARWALEEKWLLKTESAVVGSVRTVCVQEGVFKEQKEVDQDADGTGEYGWLNELCGCWPPRRKDNGSEPEPVSPVYLSTGYLLG